MNGELGQSPYRRRMLHGAMRVILFVLVASSAVAAASAMWPGAPATLPPSDGASLQAGKVWDLVDMQLEVWEGNRLVLTRTLALGPAETSHAYSVNLWQVSSSWLVTGTARLDASLHVYPPLTVREGEAAVFSASGGYGVAIQDPDRTYWGDYTHVGALGWPGGYATGCGSYYEMDDMTNASHTSSLAKSCTLTPRAHWSDRWNWTISSHSSLMWRSKTGPIVRFVVRPTYQLRPAGRVTVALGGRVNLAPQYNHVPLLGVPVTLMHSGKVLAQAVTQAPDGRYLFAQAPITSNLVLSVTLEHAAMTPPSFRVMYSQTAPMPLAYVATQPFTLTGAAASVTKDVSFSDNPGITTSLVISPARLDDLGAIYYHTHQAWQLTSQLGQPLDDRLPLDIKAYSTESKVFWRGPGTGAGSGVEPYINIEAASSDISDNSRPDNREWHEFGHAVMADMYANLMPRSPLPCHSPRQPGDECNHGGYANASTTDSWKEGFAEFFSLMVGRDIQRKPQPEIYIANGSGINLEANYLSWTGQLIQSANAPKERGFEELAVAGLLWDLVDPADADDATAFTPGGATYADCVQTDLPQLWRIISQPWGGTVAGSPLAPPTYTYVFDVKHLYDVLKHERVGWATSRGRALDDLDELFIAHGFFKDANGNRAHDAGEPIGWSGNVGVPGISDRPDRRSGPPITGSYIAYQARARQTGAAVPVQSVTVDVRFPPPLEHLSYTYRQQTGKTPGRIYFVAPDAQHGAVAYVRAWAPGWVSTSPLTVTSDLYWERMALDPEDHFVDHVFEMTRTVMIHLPLMISGFGPTVSSVDAPFAPAAPVTNARTPRACAPEPVGGTATATRTVTPTPTRTRTGEASVTATRTRTANPTPSSTPTPTASRTATRTPTRTATRTTTTTVTATVAGIYGRVTANGVAAAGRALELRLWNGSAFVLQASGATGADGRYSFKGVPALGANQHYHVRYLNAPTAPNPGAGYLWYWFANRITTYTAGATVAGGDFDIADITMTSPADGASVTLPATFCWTQRNVPSDNYRLVFRNPSTGVEAVTAFLGYVPCISITGFPADWPSGATYTWWVRVYKGTDPDATPFNYGDPSATRSVRVNR